MGHVLAVNIVILLIVTAFCGLFAREGERYLAVYVAFWTGVLLSVIFWFVVLAVNVGVST